MDDKKRTWMIWISLILLTVLAGIESSLAFMRDRIATDMEALRLSLAGVEQTAQAKSIIPMIGQMVMGFIFPFVLAFVAIPFESFIKSFRTVIGLLAAGLLRAIAFLLRLVGNTLFQTGNFLIKLSDLITFPRLFVDWLSLKQADAAQKATIKREKKRVIQERTQTELEPTA